jgi:2-iminobutanoate/2-iminopropanoate deaminase
MASNQMIERLQVPSRPESKLYSPIVRARGLVFVAGQTSRDSSGKIVHAGNFALQADQVFENLNEALATVGLSLKDLLQITIYVTDPRFRNDLRSISIKHMGGHLPASTLVVVAGLAEPEFLIEIDAIAADRI